MIMTQEWTVWCEGCSDWVRLSGNQREVQHKVRDLGWKQIKGRTVCPKCVEDLLHARRSRKE